jgi:Cof subfamily protein (haloacid dehalogenase superfamily)
MYKVIFIDLDGTLLNDKKEISDENIRQLNRAYNEKGIKTIITSGRQAGYIKKIYEKYDCHFGDYIICANGAIIKNVKTNEYLNKEYFNLDDVIFLRNIYLNSNLEYFLVYTETNSYIEKRSDMETQDEIVINNITNFLANNNLQPTLCIFGGDIKELESASEQMKTNTHILSTPISNYYTTINNEIVHHNYFDIVKDGCNKQEAIKIVLKAFNIKNDEMIVIGDGGNDVPMFECGGYKIAMGNADHIIKEKADFITDTNNNDGVAKEIKKIIFSEE